MRPVSSNDSDTRQRRPIARWMQVNAPAFESKFEGFTAGSPARSGVTEFTAWPLRDRRAHAVARVDAGHRQAHPLRSGPPTHISEIKPPGAQARGLGDRPRRPGRRLLLSGSAPMARQKKTDLKSHRDTPSEAAIEQGHGTAPPAMQLNLDFRHRAEFQGRDHRPAAADGRHPPCRSPAAYKSFEDLRRRTGR